MVDCLRMGQLPTRAPASLQRWAEADAILIHYGKMTWQTFNKPWLGQKPLQHNDYLRSSEVVRNAQNDDTVILFGWVTPDIGKIQVSSQQRSSGLTRSLCDLSIRSSRQPISRANST